VLLLNTEPRFDSAAGAQGAAALGKAQMVVTLSPFKANMDISDVLLPIAPFTETSGTFVNAEGRVQGFHAVVKPAGRDAAGLEGAARAGQPAGCAGF
jgi:NADH-quinone oxidoreductase subunit G